MLECSSDAKRADFVGYFCRHAGSPILKRIAIYTQHGMSMVKTGLFVSVVDDDESVRESLPDLLKELGFGARAFSSAEEFLASDAVAGTNCLILDIAMPRMTGPDLKRELEERGVKTPVIFITARKDEAIRSRMLEVGAVECLFKPFSDTALVEALNKALPAT